MLYFLYYRVCKTEKKPTESLKPLLGISAKVTFVALNAIERFTGKAKRVIENRKLHYYRKKGW